MAVRDVNSEVVSGLRQAMRVLGAEGNKARFARMLKASVGDGPGETTVGRWLRDEDLVPAWALLAAARISGQAAESLIADGMAVDELSRPRLAEQIRELARPDEEGGKSAAK